MTASEPAPAGPAELSPGEARVSTGGRRAAIVRWIREDEPFCIVAVLGTLAVAALYLLGRHSGGNWGWIGLPLDDNWIHLVYARSLAEQGGFFYNPGVAEAGMSSPLWVILLALVYKVFTPLGVSPQWCAKGLSLFLAPGVPIVTYYLARELKLDRQWAWAAGLLVIVEPNLAYGNVAGMEVSLFTLLTLLALWLSTQRRYTLLGIVLGLLVLTRAEGVLTAICMGAIPLILRYAKREQVTWITPGELSLGLQLFLPALLLGGAWAAYNQLVAGSFLPNTYYVKHNFALGYFNLENLVNILLGYVAQLAFFRGLLSFFAAACIIAAGVAFYRGRQTILGVLLLLIPLAQLYAFSINVKVVATGAPWTYFTRRYMDFLLPIWSLLLVAGFAFVWEWAARRRSRLAILAAPLFSLGALLLLGINVISLQRTFTEEYSWNTENVEQVNVAMGRWVGEHLPAGASIGATDAGAVRFWSQPSQHVVDLLGLNCHLCIGRPAGELLQEFKPNYLVVFRPALTEPSYYEELHRITATRNTILGGNELVAVKVLAIPPWPPPKP